MRLATLKHINSKNADYGAAEQYLLFEHDEFTMKPVLDETGRLIPREDYRLSTLNCGGEDFAVACMRANLRYEKNQRREDVKSHHYIISFDPRDGPDNGLTVDRAQALGEKFCAEHYSLMLSCRLASGKRFKRWITAEVLPTIRKNGFYITDPLLQQFARDPDFAHAVVDALYEQSERVNELVPKAYYFDAFVDPGDAVPIRIAAKQLGVSEHWFVRLLVGCRMLYRCDGRLVPYADKRFRGMFAVKERRTLVTPMGKQVLHEFIGMLTSDEKAAV